MIAKWICLQKSRLLGGMLRRALYNCKITAKTPVTRLHASSLIFRQDNQWARMSNFETGGPTSRHTVSSWDMPHTRLLPRRPWQDCMQALSSFFKNVNEQIVWLWDRTAAMWQNITRLGIGTIITWIVIWNTFSVNVPVNHLETEQSTRVRISRKFVSKNFKVLYSFWIKYLELQFMSYIVIKIRRFSS